MSSDESDIELKSALPKKVTKKMPRSPSDELLKNSQEAKKMTTKEMINQALVDLKSRKGTSLYAIKKYIQETYKVDIEKLNYIINKSIKSSVETGTVVQIKGSGASGSFKLAPKKDKPEKKKKPKKNVEKTSKAVKSDKPKKGTKESEVKEKSEKKTKKKKEISKPEDSGEKLKRKRAPAEPAQNEAKIKKSKSTKTAKALQTPAKKKSAMMKRKSIGSIIKPPKMKPRKE